MVVWKKDRLLIDPSYKHSGLTPLFRHAWNLVRHPPPPAVIPEIFSRESKFLNTVDPGLKIAGVTRRWESTFLLFLFVLLLWTIGMSPSIIWIPDKDTQEWQIRWWWRYSGMTDNGMIKAHKGDDAEAFSPGYFWSFILSSCFSLLGVYKGAAPLYS